MTYDPNSAPPPRRGGSTTWSAYGNPSARSLSHNGGHIPTQSFMDSAYGQRTYTPGIPDPEDFTDRSQISDEGLTRLGKAAVNISAPRTSSITDEGDVIEDPGFAEGMLGGLVEAFTGIVPDPARKHMVGTASNLGKVADVPIEFAGLKNIGEWLGLGTTEENFRAMPMTTEKRNIMAQMQADGINKGVYMTRYLRSHGGDLAAEKGLNTLLAPLIQPDATIWERGLMALGVPAQIVARTAAGVQNRDETILEMDTLQMHPELRAIRERYENGEFGAKGTQESQDRLLDEMTIGGFGWANDPFVSMITEMVTDPLIIATLATGGAAKAVQVGAYARRAQNIARLAYNAPKGSQVSKYVEVAQKLAATKRTPFLSKNFDETYRLADDIARQPGDEFTSIVKQAESELSRGDRAKIAAKPVIDGMARASEVINAPLSIFGSDGVGGAVARRWQAKTVDGFVSGHGTDRFARLFRLLTPEQQARLQTSGGRAATWHQRSMVGSSLTNDVRGQVLDEKGNVVRQELLPNQMTMPDEFVNAVTDSNDNPALRMRENPLEARQMESQVLRKKKDFAPQSDAEEKGMHDRAVQQVMWATGADEATAKRAIRLGDSDDYAMAHDLAWGQLLEEFPDVQRQLLQRLEGENRTSFDAQRTSSQRAKGPREGAYESLSETAKARRATPVMPGELTMGRAAKLLKSIESAGDDAAKTKVINEALPQFDALYDNFFVRTGISEEAQAAFVKRVTSWLNDNMESRTFLRTIEFENLPTELQALVTRARKSGVDLEIGQAPDINKRWRVSYDEEGRISGFNPWFEANMDGANAKMLQLDKVNRIDRVREALVKPIRAENLQMKARRKFMRYLGKELNIDRNQSNTIWKEIQKASSRRKTTMRSFTTEEFNEIVENLQFPPETMQRLGQHGIAMAVAKAIEGDLSEVGVTTKMTGKMKTRTAKYGNFMGVISEKLYPQMRFNLNPFFWVQEWVEPFYFNILRGVKVGVRYTKEHSQQHALLDSVNGATLLADGFEARDAAVSGGYRAREAFGPDTELSLGAVDIGRTQNVKQNAHMHLLNERFGDMTQAQFERFFPGQWPRIQAAMNHLDKLATNGKGGNLTPGTIAVRYLAHKGMFDVDKPTSGIHLFDMSVPDDIGRVDGIRKSHLASLFNESDSKALRQSIKDGKYDEWQFKERLVLHRGASLDYANRAWDVARGLEVDEVVESAVAGFPDQATKDIVSGQMRAWFRFMAETKNISVEEYVARKFNNTTKWMDSSARLPARSHPQVMKREFDGYNWEVIPADDPRAVAVRERGNQMFPEGEHSTVNAHRNASVKAQAGQDTTRGGGQHRVSENKNIEGIELLADLTTDEFLRTQDAWMSEADTLGAGKWYEEMGPAFTSYFEELPESDIRSLAKLMDEKMGSLAPTRGKQVDAALARVEKAPGAKGSWAARDDAEMTAHMNKMSEEAFDEFFVPHLDGGEQVVVKQSPMTGRVHYYYDKNGDFAGYVGVDKNSKVTAVQTMPSIRGKGVGTQMYDYIQKNTDIDMVDAVGHGTMTDAGRGLAQKFLREQSDISVMRQEVAARALMAWGATQIQTSPRAGFGFLTRLIDELNRGKRDGWGNQLGLGIQDTQFRKMIGEFEEHLSMTGLGAKLHDFIDSLLGNRERTFMRDGGQTFINRQGKEVPMQPGAMDVWMGRDMGFIDTGVLQYVAQRLSKARGLDYDINTLDNPAMVQAQIETGFFAMMDGEKKGPYRERKQAFEKKHGVELQEAWDGRPSPGEYEYMLTRYNAITDELNEMGYLGRGYADELGDEWTVADVQAIRWVGYQKMMGADTGGPNNMFGDNAATLTYEYRPVDHTPHIDNFHLEGADPDVVDRVTVATTNVMTDIIQRETGVTFMDYIPGYGATGDVMSRNTVWRISGNPDAIADAIDIAQLLSQEGEVMALKTPNPLPGNIAPTVNTAKTIWGIDFKPEVGDQRTLDNLYVWLDGKMDWEGSTNGMLEQSPVVRTVYRDIDVGLDEAGFAGAKPIDPEVMAKLESGEWATEAGMDSAIPVTVGRNLYGDVGRKHNFTADRNRAEKRIKKGEEPEAVYREEIGKKAYQRLEKRGRKDVARRVRDEHLATIQGVADQALKEADPESWAGTRGRHQLLEGVGPGERTAYQSTTSGSGYRGATAWNRTRQASERVASGELGTRRGRLHLWDGNADATTATHELWHFFSDDLDPSAVNRLNAHYYSRVAKKKNPGKANSLAPEVEEYYAQQFEAYAATGVAPEGPMAPLFNAFADAYENVYGEQAKPVAKPVADVFGQIDQNVRSGPSATFDVDQFRINEAMRTSLQRADDEAWRVQYYKRGRTMLERTINHPYLGLYPFSYMWGKVLPEMVRFLVRKPFGIDAPFAGMQMANHVWEAVQLEMATGDPSDPNTKGEFQKFVENYPEALRFLQLLVPGTPWDLPVNFPAWTRRIAQQAYKGKEVTPAFLGGALTDTISYAFGPGRAPKDFLDVIGEVGGQGGRDVVNTLRPGAFPTAEEEENREPTEPRLGLGRPVE